MIQLKLIPIHKLKQHEEIMCKNYQKLILEIKKNKFIYPIIVDKNNLVILDGHHRFNILKKLNFKKIPCYLVDYFDEKTISVLPRRKEIPINKKTIIKMGLSPGVFPAKTTKHIIHIKFKKIKYNLSKLK